MKKNVISRYGQAFESKVLLVNQLQADYRETRNRAVNASMTVKSNRLADEAKKLLSPSHLSNQTSLKPLRVNLQKRNPLLHRSINQPLTDFEMVALSAVGRNDIDQNRKSTKESLVSINNDLSAPYQDIALQASVIHPKVIERIRVNSFSPMNEESSESGIQLDSSKKALGMVELPTIFSHLQTPASGKA